MFSIVISEKGGSERLESFEQREVTVGRVQGNDLMLPKGNVSKRHCRLESINGRFVVTDQNSTNGTYVNRRRITQSTVVRQGDRIYVGDFILRVDEHVSEQDDSSDIGVAEALDDSGPGMPAELEAAAPEQVAEAAEPSLHPSPAPERHGAATTGGPRVSLTAKYEGLPTGPMAPSVSPDPQSEELSSAVRLLVERVSSKLEPRILDREVDQPLAERVDRLLDDVYTEQAGPDALAPGVSAEAVKGAARAELVALGPIGALLDDPSVSEIAASGVGFLRVLRGPQQESSGLAFAAESSVERTISRLCRQEGEPHGEDEWVVRRHLASLGFELDALRGPAAPGGALLRLRRRDRIVSDFEELVRAGVVSRSMATFLQHCVRARSNILVVGVRRSGATEVLSALCGAAGPDRVLALQDEDELGSSYGSVLPLAASTRVSSDALLTAVSGFPGHRLLIDSMAGERAQATLRAIADGADGTAARIRGSGVERACSRVCTDLAMSGTGLTAAAVADALVASFDVVVEVARLNDGRSRVLRICELRRGEDTVVAADSIFDFVAERTATGGSVEGSFNPSGRSPQVANDIRARGNRLDSALFVRPPSSG